MERIVDSITVDHSRVFTLLDTYRSHPSILKLYNKLIYADVLMCRCPPSSHDMIKWSGNPLDQRGTRHPVIFHHCNGQESRQKDSPSWQNIMEGEVVKNYLQELLELLRLWYFRPNKNSQGWKKCRSASREIPRFFPIEVWSRSRGHWHHHPLLQAMPALKEHLPRAQNKHWGGYHGTVSGPWKADHFDVHGAFSTGARANIWVRMNKTRVQEPNHVASKSYESESYVCSRW